MADETFATEAEEPTVTETEQTAGITPEVSSQEGALVGDAAIADAARDPFVVDHTDDQAKAQRVTEREPDPEYVPVKETHVQYDEVITDPSSPLAVQVPDAGRGDASTPIARAALGAKTVEEVFASES